MTTDTFVPQVGGKHYSGEVQHWDVMEKYDVDYLLGQGTKYLMRWRVSGKARIDLGKSASYLQKAILCRPGQGARRLVPQAALDELYAACRTHHHDTTIINRVLASGSHDDLVWALEQVREMEASAS